MLHRKGHVVQLRLKPRQEQELKQFLGCARFLWNKAYFLNLDRLKNKASILRYYELDFWSKLWKSSNEYGFLAACPSQVLQQKLKDLDKAFMDAFDKKQSKESPGKKVKAKSGLNKSVLDQGWGNFREKLEYKLAWKGGSLLVVDPKYTSQTCHSCHHKDSASRLSQSEFVCTACGLHVNADLNAAMNILRAGHARLACSAA
ncbi:MAG: RNA-guided endonuclease InsQ/TnpB family protein [Gammaproteobacteria bacterium]